MLDFVELTRKCKNELKPKEPSSASSLLAGLLILIQGIVRLVRAEWAQDFGFGEITRRFFGETFLTTRGIFVVVFGIIVLLGAF